MTTVRNGLIFFTGYDVANGVHYITAAGLHETTVVSASIAPAWPAVSPGRELIYLGSSGDLYKMQLPSGSPVQLTSTGGPPEVAWQGTWAPDGSAIYFSHFDAFGWHFAVMAPDGTGQTDIFDPSVGFSYGNMVCSPDGTKLYYSENNRLRRVNVDGTGDTNIYTLPSGICVGGISVNPAGTHLLFTRSLAGVRSVWKVAVGGSGAVQLASPASGPAFSPDGTKIVYDDEAGSLYTMNADGSSQTLLYTPPGGSAESSFWSHVPGFGGWTMGAVAF